MRHHVVILSDPHEIVSPNKTWPDKPDVSNMEIVVKYKMIKLELVGAIRNKSDVTINLNFVLNFLPEYPNVV